MDRVLLSNLVAPLALACACASSPSAPYWESARGEGAAQFALANERCGAAATRIAPTPRADQLPGGAVAPANRIDRPPRIWANGVAERAYMDCMDREGWHVARRLKKKESPDASGLSQSDAAGDQLIVSMIGPAMPALLLASPQYQPRIACVPAGRLDVVERAMRVRPPLQARCRGDFFILNH